MVPKSAEQAFDSILTCQPKIDLVFAHNDRMAAGAHTAALRHGRANKMLFVGVDALPGKGLGVELVANGILDGTFIYPTGGDRVVQVAMSILEGKKYQRENLLSTAPVNRQNAHVMQMQTDHIATLDGKLRSSTASWMPSCSAIPPNACSSTPASSLSCW